MNYYFPEIGNFEMWALDWAARSLFNMFAYLSISLLICAIFFELSRVCFKYCEDKYGYGKSDKESHQEQEDNQESKEKQPVLIGVGKMLFIFSILAALREIWDFIYLVSHVKL